MKNETKFRINLDGLDDIAAKVGGKMRARVGVLGSDVERDHGQGLDNSTLMLIHMMGSISRNIPPRDPLYLPLMNRRRELIRMLGESSAMKTAFANGDYEKMFKLLGAAAEAIVDEAFATSGWGAWPPNTPETIRRKGSSRPLIEFGELRKSVSSDVVKSSSQTAPARSP